MLEEILTGDDEDGISRFFNNLDSSIKINLDKVFIGDNDFLKSIKSDINIDGYLKEEIWNRSSKIEDFIQVDPKYFENPSEATHVQLAYDDSFLYIGATLFSKSNSIVQKFGDYYSFDESFDNNSDYFIVEIDSDHNHDKYRGGNWKCSWGISN